MIKAATTTHVIVRCNLCNRPLTDPKSIRRGIGPICYAKEQKRIKFEEIRRTENNRIWDQCKEKKTK